MSERTIGSPMNEWASGMILAADGNPVIVGQTRSGPTEPPAVLLLKIGASSSTSDQDSESS